MSTPENRAVYLTAVGSPLEIREAPYSQPKSGEVLVKVHAVAINPIDWIIQRQGNLVAPWLKYPCVIGTDVAGEVVEIGPQTTPLKSGDRVLGHAVGFEKAFNTSTQGAFQQYVILQAHVTCPIPSNISYEDACVVPLGVSTAACTLYQPEQLGLSKPKVTGTSPIGETVLVWGGSTSVGCNAIQLAAASGYEVVTTCSPRNFELVKSLGATEAFDYNKPNVINDITKYLGSKKVAGAVSAGHGSASNCIAILKKCKGSKKLVMISFPGPPSPPKRFVQFQSAYYYITGMISITIQSYLAGVTSVFTWGGAIATEKLGAEIYNEFLPQALEQGKFRPAPQPEVVGHGLEDIPKAMEMQAKGVSAKKLVVLLDSA